MTSIIQCQNNIGKYLKLKEDIQSILSNLTPVIQNIDDISNIIKEKYLVDESPTTIVSSFSNLKQDITGTYHHLKNDILPSIDSTLYHLKNEIERLEKKEVDRKVKEELEKN